jgi:hypothetical protein
MVRNDTSSSPVNEHTASGRRTTTPTLAPDDGLFELPGIGPLWVWAHTCPDQHCNCRDALILASDESREALLTRGLPVREAWQAGQGYVDIAARIEGLTSFILNIDAVTVADLYGNPLTVADADSRIAAMVDRIHSDVLDEIARLWYIGKGYPDQRKLVLGAKTIAISPWQEGDMVAYLDVFKWARRDQYVFDDEPEIFQVFDGYCINPGCNCGKVVVQFCQLEVEGESQAVGEIEIDPSGTFALESEPKCEAILDRLWATFRKRHPAYPAYFAQRNADMKCIGKKREAFHRPKIGRNEPCPCGSGKKYKKCCADATSDQTE